MAPTTERPERLRCALFDLDGTLVDSSADIASALDAALARHGFAPAGRENVLRFVGDGAPALVERALGFVGAPEREAAAVLASYVELYRANHLDETRLYPHAAETLAALGARGVRCGVVTNKPHEFSVSLLEHLGVAAMLDVVVGGDSLPFRKPSAEPVLAALAACGARPHEGVMVGDGEPDMRAGAAAGVFTVGVTYGYRDAETLLASGARALVPTLADLLPLLDAGR